MDESTALGKLRDGLSRRLMHNKTEIRRVAGDAPAILLVYRFDSTYVFAVWDAQAGFTVSSDVDRQPKERKEVGFPGAWEAMEQVVAWIGKRPTLDPVGLVELRWKAGIRQSELARRLSIKQPSVAGLERPERLAKMRVDKLARAVQALGGKLKVTATLADGIERELNLNSPA